MPSLLMEEEVVIAFQGFPEMEMHETCAPWGSLGIDKPPPRPGGGTGAWRRIESGS
ncbi:hypothetical protein PUR59_01740 [Streptomyces sp. SP18ES09]|uniref:hypothetical protein n=1 Tax=Streptomyces sp. SP18ES09 TaxID=3002532 RepID=UPI002E7778D0|nr:hypothetical protein [Streptomyces sp. SP18ES09]MEE1813764.1 hypothetical protein [Streptomyces sp. SP18ES09]